MSTNANDSAFTNERYDRNGFSSRRVESDPLTKREYFAAMAMQGILASFEEDGGGAGWPDKVAKASVEYADALITALNQEHNQ